MVFLNHTLYVILDVAATLLHGREVVDLAKEVIDGGTDIIQFRFKGITDKAALDYASKISEIVHKENKIFIVNDRPDIARLAAADGVHLGAKDIPVKEARKIVGDRALIGKTVHSKKELDIFRDEGVNYLAGGPAFATATKMDLVVMGVSALVSLARKSQCTFFAIGGITLSNVGSLVDNGITNIALCQGIFGGGSIAKTVKEFKQCLNKAS